MEKEIAQELLKIKAVSLSPKDPYTWASGIKSPIYCDNRITMSYPETRKKIANEIANIIREKYPETEVVAGTATAGIPHAAWVADILNLPMIYIRGKAKDHGKENQIEGLLKKGQKVVVIEDLISMAGSVIDATKPIIELGAKVLGIVAIFTYELPKGKENIKNANIKVNTLTNYSTLLEVAHEMNYITEEEIEILKEWKNNPEKWKNS